MKLVRHNGSGAIEAILGLAILFTAIFALLRTYNYYLRFALIHKYDLQSALLLEEGIEAVKLIRDTGWDNKISTLSLATNYGLAFVDSQWTATTTRQYVDGVFDRFFVINDVYRDLNDNLADSGTLDINSKKIIVYVSYKNGFSTTTRSISAYMTKLFNN